MDEEKTVLRIEISEKDSDDHVSVEVTAKGKTVALIAYVGQAREKLTEVLDHLVDDLARTKDGE